MIRQGLSSLTGLVRSASRGDRAELARQMRWLRRKAEARALATYDRMFSVWPGYPEALCRRARAHASASRFVEALACYDRALKFRPRDVIALFGRATTLRRLRYSDEALATLDSALAIKPDFVEAIVSRAKILRMRGDADEAIKGMRQALKLRPADSELHTTLIFTLNFDPSVSEAVKQHERTEWDRMHAQRFRTQWKRHDNAPDPNRRLRIGYCSSVFRHDNACYGFGNAILEHDAGCFEVFCYSDTENEDDVTDSLRARSDHWRRTRDLSDDQMAELIRRDRIDILVDCVGHMNGNRLLVFARKPAPVQVTGWGEPTGTGLKAIDYLLASPVLVPEKDRPLFAERVIDLSNFTGLWVPGLLPEVGPLPALSNGHITFGSFNRLVKIGAPAIACWATILKRLPGSRLVLKNMELADPAQRLRFQQSFEVEGVPAETLSFLRGSDRYSHFDAYNLIDIALDPFPHGGGMTTLDALWMGVPVVTWVGATVSSRWAATSLAPLGLTDFMADSPERYVEIALAKASDLNALAKLRADLRGRVANSDFGNGPRYCRALEAAYREMWQRWCEQQRAEAAQPRAANGANLSPAQAGEG